MEILLELTSNKLMKDSILQAGNPVKEILLKLNQPDHRILKDGVEVSINSIIESSDAIFDENIFSLVFRPSIGIPKGTEDIGGLVVPEEVTEEVVQQAEHELRISKRNRTPYNFIHEYQLYLIEGIKDEVSNQHSYCFNVEDESKTFDEAMKSQDVAFWKEAINDEMDSIMDLQGVECCGGFGYKVVTKGCLEALEVKGGDGGACKVLGRLLGDAREVLEGTVSSIPIVLSCVDRISSDGFLPSILLLVVVIVTVIIVVVAVILIVVVAIVVVVFVVTIIGVVVVVGVSDIIKLLFVIIDIKSKESTLQLVYDVMRICPFFKAFLMDNKKHIVKLESFRDIIHICPRVHGQSFDEPPFEEEILAFIRFLGHNAAIRTLTDVNINKLYQPWRSFAAIINKCLTEKSSGYDNLRLSQA
nr:zinc finger, CCHC-type [Tanacetum cinerariifolium]